PDLFTQESPMNLQTQNRPPRPQTRPAGTPLAEGGNGTPQNPTTGERAVLVSHGIHRGHFPITGMRVSEARRTLARLLNLDPAAVAVINGQVVAEDTTIGEDVSLLSFVKPSAVKG